MFKYTIIFKDNKKKNVIADRWIASPVPDATWMIFMVDDQEILRVKIDEIRVLERRII